MRPATPWAKAVLAGGAASMLAACAVSGYDSGGGAEVGYVGGYYEPWGYDYGGWGRGYRVGPPRGEWGRGGERGPPGAHPPGAGHPMGGPHGAPSIPARPRG